MKIQRPISPKARGPPGKKDEYVLRDSEHRIVPYNPPSAYADDPGGHPLTTPISERSNDYERRNHPPPGNGGGEKETQP